MAHISKQEKTSAKTLWEHVLCFWIDHLKEMSLVYTTIPTLCW